MIWHEKRAICELLQSLFTTDELRRFVAVLPQSRSLINGLPGGTASLAALSVAVVDALERFGLLDDNLFEHLEAERPKRSTDIAAVQAAWQRAVASRRSDRDGAIESDHDTVFPGMDDLGESWLPTASTGAPDAASTRQTMGTGTRIFVEPVAQIRFLPVPGGLFAMGARSGSTQPGQHIRQTRLSPYWLAETPVTNRQYRTFLTARSETSEPVYWRDQRFNRPQQPVVGVNWYEAKEFCRWLSEELGLVISLPTEAQWEFAARGTDGRDYPWGSEPPDSTRAYFGERWNIACPRPVASLLASRGPFGHLDLAGNVMEWCLGSHGIDAAWQNHGPGSVATEPEHELPDISVKGGAYGDGPSELRAAYRRMIHATVASPALGFRVALMRVPAQASQSVHALGSNRE